MIKLLSLLKSFVGQPDDHESIDSDNILAFIVDKNNDPMISTIFNSYSEDDAKKFGNLIYKLNHGLFEESMFKFLQEKAQDPDNNPEFINKILWYWGTEEYYNSNPIKEEKPFISPTDFSKANHK